jgi:hypothetical protein
VSDPRATEATVLELAATAIQETVRRKLLRDIPPEDLSTCMSVFAGILANMDAP